MCPTLKGPVPQASQRNPNRFQVNIDHGWPRALLTLGRSSDYIRTFKHLQHAKLHAHAELFQPTSCQLLRMCEVSLQSQWPSSAKTNTIFLRPRAPPRHHSEGRKYSLRTRAVRFEQTSPQKVQAFPRNVKICVWPQPNTWFYKNYC